MLLIIEDKDNPAEPVAEETAGGSELVYIPVITAPAVGDAPSVRRECALERLLYEFRQCGTQEETLPCRQGGLVALFLHSLAGTGRRPEYVTSSESSAAELAEEPGLKFCSRG